MPEVATALGIGFGAAIACFPLFALRKNVRAAVLIPLSVAILCAPLAIAVQHPFVRWVCAIVSVTLVVKLYDLHVFSDAARRPTLKEYLPFLCNSLCHVWRRSDVSPRRSLSENLKRLAFAGAGLALGIATLYAVATVDWSQQPFVLEHSVKVSVFCLTVYAGAVAVESSWRLMGGRGGPFMNDPLLAVTPADFWRRYNCPVHELLYEDVFRPAGGRRAPVRGMLLVFLVSGIVHEYVFSIAIGQIQGIQMLFFMLQGCAVALTYRLKPRGYRAIGWRIGTVVFNLVAAVLFFRSMQTLFPFYAARAN